MSLHTTDVIVLRRYLYRETSVIVSLLSDRYGKFRGLVKGLRTYPNRHHSAMEPMTVNRIVFYDTRTSQLHLISQCDLLSPLSSIQQDLDTARAAARCVELTDVVMPLEQPHPLVYGLLKDTLERLALSAGQVRTIDMHFTVRLLRLAGFQPQVDSCTGCNRELDREGYWSARQGGLLCPACLHQDPRAPRADAELLDTLHALSHTNQPPALAEHVIAGLRQRLEEFLRWRLDRPLKTVLV